MCGELNAVNSKMMLAKKEIIFRLSLDIFIREDCWLSVSVLFLKFAE
jgi:hypothetical protein